MGTSLVAPDQQVRSPRMVAPRDQGAVSRPRRAATASCTGQLSSTPPDVSRASHQAAVSVT
jgi:hypothetical protein